MHGRAIEFRLALRVGLVAIGFFSAVSFGPSASSAEDATPAVLQGVAAYNRGDFGFAFRALSAEAARGNADAQVNLGYMFARGQGTARNSAYALKLYELSADKGNGEGMNAVGFRANFANPPNIPLAVHWYCLAIARGNPRAFNNLALLLEAGNGVPRDVSEARSLWLQSAQQGHVNAMYNLGHSLVSEQPSSAEGISWLWQAAAAGHAIAQKLLRSAGDRSVFPAPVDEALMMTIQPASSPPGRARICGDLIS